MYIKGTHFWHTLTVKHPGPEKVTPRTEMRHGSSRILTLTLRGY